MKYSVSRHIREHNIVELTIGGSNYINADALVAKWSEETEYDNPVEAAEATIKVAKLWSESTGESIEIGYGTTLGTYLPFDPCHPQELNEWAEKEYENLPKCDECGDILGKRHFTFAPTESVFCSEECAEKHIEGYNGESE